MRRPRSVVLAYHNVVSDGGGGEAALHLPARRFEAHLRALARRYDVIPLEEVVGVARRESGRPAVALTFDDAYRGATTVGVDLLASYGLPATFFVVPGLVGSEGFWWDAVADDSTGVIEAEARELALGELRGLTSEVRRRWAEERRPWNAVGPERRPADLDELRAAARVPGLHFGSHTWNHPNLSVIPPDEIRDEMSRPIPWIQKHLPGCWIPWITYPYGRTSRAAIKAAADVGYAGALRVDGGAIPHDDRQLRHALPRISVPAGLSVDGLILRIDGLLN
jgi:peptidoglycan/xylan/chitin deacetylase (PgdA/CDA1 family)